VGAALARDVNSARAGGFFFLGGFSLELVDLGLGFGDIL
jgi:hypothetical protein